MAEIVAVVGPTATGKSALGIEIARSLGGEVVNADSMQLYRGMDVGTAKLTEAERGGVAHHLLDVLDVTEPSTVADYQERARAAIEDIQRRGRTPVFVGGSGLYLRAALDELDFPGTDDEVRARLEQRLAEVGAAALHRELVAADPVAAARILPSNGRRVVRALEVIEITGRPYSSHAGMTAYVGAYGVRYVGIEPTLPELDQRIEERVARMWAAGFVDEVRRLEAGLRAGRTSWRALGYRQLLGHLAGECTEDEARRRTVQATRRFVRRQLSWFRRDPRIRWVPMGAACGVADALSDTTAAR
jgi:tRNA dimethylallyltransferase